MVDIGAEDVGAGRLVAFFSFSSSGIQVRFGIHELLSLNRTNYLRYSIICIVKTTLARGLVQIAGQKSRENSRQEVAIQKSRCP